MTQPSEPSPFIIIPIILGFAVVFPLMWMGVVGLISVVGGWSSLAGRYGCATPPAGKRRGSVSGLFGMASYKFTLELIVAEEGLYLATQALFRAFHKPLFIPWAEVRDLQPVESGYLRMVGYRSRFKVGSTTVTLSLAPEELQPLIRA